MRQFHFRKGNDQSAYLQSFIEERLKEVFEDHSTAVITVKPYEDKRSLNANNLYWKWIEILTAYYESNKIMIDDYVVIDGNITLCFKRVMNKQDVHEMLKKKFLGKRVKKIGGELISSIRSTTELSKSEMCDYMRKVYQFSYDIAGISLPDPVDNEYQKFIDSQNTGLSYLQDNV